MSRRLEIFGMRTRLFPAIAIVMLHASLSAADTAQVARQFREFCLQESTDHGNRLLDDVEIPTAKETEIRRYLAAQKSDGSWPDIDYTDKSRSAWRPADHLTRMLALIVRARQNAIDPDERNRCIAAVHSAMTFWIARDFNCPNWWYNEIGVPKMLGNIALLLDTDLHDPERSYITSIAMARSKVGSMTGQNRVWLAGNGIMRAALSNDDALLKKSTDVIAEEIRITDGEGIQPDFSFHQHGPQQQFGNYGMAFAVEMCKWACVLRSTPFAFSDDKLAILRNYLLLGQNWVTWNGAMDISSCGRQLFPGSPGKKAGVIRGVFRTMIKADPQHAANYRAFVDRNTNGGANDLVGDRFFWRSDYLIHRTPTVMVSLKMSSARVIGGETVNSENLQGLHLADGATFIYRTGREYDDIFPVWDWRKIPGTTEVQNDAPLDWSSKTSHLKTDFVGGACDGQTSCCAMHFERDGLQAKKAWFFAGNTILCLGADITSNANDAVLTTIDQCLSEKTARTGPPTNGGYAWIEHAGIRYTSLAGPAIQLTDQQQTGTWTSVFRNPSSPKQPISKQILTLSISHGSHPNAAAYAYSISPAEIKLPEIKIIANDAKLQAVKIGDWAAAVCWTSTAADLDGHLLAVESPCIVLNDAGKWTVCDPTQKLKSLRLSIDGKAHAIDLPQGPEAGKSVLVP
jgi:chondroitin AC lyase